MKRALHRGVELIGSILLLFVVGCASPSNNDERTTRLEDLEKIRDALQQYAIFLDDGRIDDYLSLYTENAVFTAADVVYEGRDEIRRELIPWAEYATIAELLDACDEYFRATGREITLEYILIREIKVKIHSISC